MLFSNYTSCCFNRITRMSWLLLIRKTMRHSLIFFTENMVMVNSSVESLLGRRFSMLLLMILQFQSGYGSRLQEVLVCHHVWICFHVRV